jgi:hypothetical protein
LSCSLAIAREPNGDKESATRSAGAFTGQADFLKGEKRATKKITTTRVVLLDDPCGDVLLDDPCGD